MLQFESGKGVELCDGLSRRDFLRVGALAAGGVGLALADLVQAHQAGGDSDDVNCILLFLVGGPSHLDTWDLKPAAPESIRGPFQPIPTNVPGVTIGEHLPLMARMADRYALVRSVHHDAAPIHETRHQLMQTGRLFQNGVEYPHYGAVLSHLLGERERGVPPFVVLPGEIANTGVSISHGQMAGDRFAVEGFSFRHLDPSQERNFLDCLKAVDAAQRAVDEGANDATVKLPPGDAFGNVFSPRAKKAFDLDREESPVRARYGRS